MFESLRRRLVSEVEDAIKQAVSPLAAYAKRLSGGVVLMLLSVWTLSLMLFFLACSLFCEIANLPYVAASLWTAGAAFILSLLLVLIGVSMMKKPR